MAESAFTFLRGTAHLFWSDPGADERLSDFGDPRVRGWVQGDLHTDNFGAFDNDRGTVVYDLNDFDEAVLADP